jgi:hypothetical protein
MDARRTPTWRSNNRGLMLAMVMCERPSGLASRPVPAAQRKIIDDYTL